MKNAESGEGRGENRVDYYGLGSMRTLLEFLEGQLLALKVPIEFTEVWEEETDREHPERGEAICFSIKVREGG